MRIQSVSANSFQYNNQYSAGMDNLSANTTGTGQGGKTKSSYSQHYDILELSDISLGDNNTLDVEDIEAALQSNMSISKRSIRASMHSASLQKPRFSNVGFDTHFLKNKPDEFITQAAKVFASYLNPGMSGGDDKVFAYAGSDFETAFNEYVDDVSRQYATELAGFFSSDGQVSDGQVDALVGQITQVIKEYGTQLAGGKDGGVDKLTSKLNINGVEMSIGDLNTTVSTINDINPTRMILDSHADFAVAGIGVAKMNAFSNTTFKQPVADMIMKTYNEKVSEEFNKNDAKIELSKKVSTKSSFLERYLNGDNPQIENAKKNSTVDPYYKVDAKFKGSAKEEIFNLFSKIDISDIDKSNKDYAGAVAKFSETMHKWESKRGRALLSTELKSYELKISAAYEGFDNYISTSGGLKMGLQSDHASFH